MTQNAREECHPLFVAQVAGSEKEMGEQLGEMVKSVGGWEETLAYYPQLVSRVLAAHSPLVRQLLRPLVEWALWRLESRRETAFQEREQAFVKALGLSAKQARYYQIFDVLQNIVNTAARRQLGPFQEVMAASIPPMCTTLVSWGKATDDGSLRHARNFDLPGVGFFERRPSVVFCSPKEGLKYGYVSVRSGDICSINAFNEAGLSITTHNRFHTSSTWKGTVIGDLCHKIAKFAQTLKEAEHIAQSMMPIASTYGIAISSSEEGAAISLETSASHFQVVKPCEEEDYLAVTNHYINPKMRKEEVAVSPGRILNSEARYDFMRERAAVGGLSLEQTQLLLASHEEPGNTGHVRACGGVVSQVHTVQSIVMDPSKKQLHLSVGPVPTGEGPWVTIPWRWSMSPAYEVKTFSEHSLPITIDPAFAEAPKQAGRRALVEASTIHWKTGDKKASTQWLEQAVNADPDEPSYRLLLGASRMQEGRWEEALEQFEEGLKKEHHSFYYGQLLLWSVRVAQQLGQEEKAALWRKELLQTTDRLLRSHRILVEEEKETPLKASKLKKVVLNYHLCDLQG